MGSISESAKYDVRKGLLLWKESLGHGNQPLETIWNLLMASRDAPQ